MQNNIIMALRKRAKNRGYQEISIKQDPKRKEIYTVSAIDPLTGNKVKATLDQYIWGAKLKPKKKKNTSW